MVKEITKAKMIQLYEQDKIYDIINVKDKVYAKLAHPQDENSFIVWCNV